MKKIGRPTDAPKTIVKRARMSEDDIKKLQKCCDVLHVTASEQVNAQESSFIRKNI